MEQRVTPYLLYEDGPAAIAWLTDAFGFREVNRATGAGAEIVEEPNDLPFGHRRYGCRDPQGHEWSFASPIGDTGGR